MISKVTVLYDNIGSSLGRLVAQAHEQLTLVAPFIKQGPLVHQRLGLSRDSFDDLMQEFM